MRIASLSLLLALTACGTTGGTTSDDGMVPAGADLTGDTTADMAGAPAADMTSNPIADLTVENACPKGLFWLKGTKGGTTIGGVAVGQGITSRSMPNPGDPWFDDMVTNVYMDSYSMPPGQLRAVFDLNVDEAGKSIKVTGMAVAQLPIASPQTPIISASGGFEATLEICDPLMDGKDRTFNVTCSGAGTFGSRASLDFGGVNACAFEGNPRAWTAMPRAIVAKPTGRRGVASVALKLSYDAIGGGPKGNSESISPTFTLSLQ